MICIVGTRGSGKSTALLKVARATGLPVATASRCRADSLKRLAFRSGYGDVRVVRAPFCTHPRSSPSICVDEAQAALEMHFGYPVEVCAFDASAFDFSGVTLLELIAAWFRSRRVKKPEDIDLEGESDA
ncbi:MAG: hypothetical protein HFJ72_08495 [Adlercreutzia sp.]|nr:hypothetical protein [Adlercreutzia sp.]